MTHRTRAFWSTRIVLAVGVVATAIAVLGAPALMAPCFGCDNPAVLGLPSNVLLGVSAIALSVFGLVWMVSVVRGPRDDPPAWRYRD